jgi:hypothetical protein
LSGHGFAAWRGDQERHFVDGGVPDDLGLRLRDLLDFKQFAALKVHLQPVGADGLLSPSRWIGNGHEEFVAEDGENDLPGEWRAWAGALVLAGV